MDEFIRRLQEAGVQVKPPVMHEIALDEDKKVPALTPWDFGGGTFLRFYFQEGSVQCPPLPWVKPAIRSKTFKVRGPKSWGKLIEHIKFLVDTLQKREQEAETKRQNTQAREEVVRKIQKRFPRGGKFLTSDHQGYTFTYNGTDMDLLSALTETAEKHLRGRDR